MNKGQPYLHMVKQFNSITHKYIVSTTQKWCWTERKKTHKTWEACLPFLQFSGMNVFTFVHLLLQFYFDMSKNKQITLLWPQQGYTKHPFFRQFNATLMSVMGNFENQSIVVDNSNNVTLDKSIDE